MYIFAEVKTRELPDHTATLGWHTAVWSLPSHSNMAACSF